MNKLFKIFLIAFVIPSIGSAQTASSTDLFGQYQTEVVLSLTLVVSLIGLLTAVVALQTLRVLLKETQEEVEEESKESFWSTWLTKVNAAAPVEQEAVVMTNHEYDGIRELDNRLPPWWLYGFYFTIAFGVAYLFYHYVGSGRTQAEEYEYEVALAEEKIKAYLAENSDIEQVNEETVEFVDTEFALNDGASIYKQNCATCHGNEGQGGIGPNFADKYWIHGGDMSSIFKTIKYGVQEKGMISWEGLLSPSQMQNVASFIYTLEGTNPPNPKDKQGDLFEREVESESEETQEEGTEEVEGEEPEETESAQALLIK